MGRQFKTFEHWPRRDFRNLLKKAVILSLSRDSQVNGPTGNYSYRWSQPYCGCNPVLMIMNRQVGTAGRVTARNNASQLTGCAGDEGNFPRKIDFHGFASNTTSLMSSIDSNGDTRNVSRFRRSQENRHVANIDG